MNDIEDINPENKELIESWLRYRKERGSRGVSILHKVEYTPLFLNPLYYIVGEKIAKKYDIIYNAPNKFNVSLGDNEKEIKDSFGRLYSACKLYKSLIESKQMEEIIQRAEQSIDKLLETF